MPVDNKGTKEYRVLDVEVSGIMNTEYAGGQAVSYTHLDVYKRQMQLSHRLQGTNYIQEIMYIINLKKQK